MQELNKRSLTYYLIFTFLLTYGIGFIVYLLGGLWEVPLLSTSIMLIPALVAIIVILMTEQWKNFSTFRQTLGIRLGKKRYIFIYPFFTLIIIVFIYLLTYFIFPEVFIPRSKLPAVMEEFQLQLGTTPVIVQILVVFFLNSVLGSVINIPFLLGEEIGWRSFLYPRLEKLYHHRLAVLIGGVIWGVWHAPMILMGHNYPSTPILGVFMMTLFCIPVGMIFYYFYIKSGSILPVALAHGVLNQTASTIHMIFIDQQVIQPVIHGVTGVVGIITFSVFAFILYKRWPREKLQ